MKPSTTRALVIGGVVLAALGIGGGIAYAASKQEAPAQPITAPSQLVHGHRYKIVVTAPSTPFDQAKADGLTVPDAQAVFDAVMPGAIKVVSVSLQAFGQGAQGTIFIDMAGPTSPVPDVPPQLSQEMARVSAKISVVDQGMSPVGYAGAPGLGAPFHPRRAMRVFA